jgi:superfamily II DNA/RNA helicase
MIFCMTEVIDIVRKIVIEKFPLLGQPLHYHAAQSEEDEDSSIVLALLKLLETGSNRILIITSAGRRGVDLPNCCCVVDLNTSTNSLEDMMQMTKRAGRAG